MKTKFTFKSILTIVWYYFSKKKIKKDYIAVLVFCALGILSYSNTFNTPFVLDDKDSILENRHIRMTSLSIDNFRQILKSPAPNRPIANLSFAINYYLHGYSLPGYHLLNLIIHLISAMLLYFIFRETLAIININGHKIPFFATALWTVNPLHTQSVTYVVQRMTSLSAMFYLFSFLLYIKARKLYKNESNYPNKYVTGLTCISLISWFAAMGSKEIAISLPAFILLYEWFFFQDLELHWMKKKYFLVIGFFFILVSAAFIFVGTDPVHTILATYDHRDFSLMQRLLTETRVVIFYITLLLFPHPSRLNLDHDFPISYSLLNPAATLFSFAVILLLIVTACILSKKEKLLSFSIFWFFGNLLIESSFVGLELIFEHRTYLPSVFLFVTAIVFLVTKIKYPLISTIILCICIFVCGMWTFQRNSIWKDEISLWTDCVKKSPGKARSHVTLAIALAKNGHMSEAIAHNKKAIFLDPFNKKAHIELGTDFVLIGDYDNGIDFLKKTLNLVPNSTIAHYNLGVAYLCIGKIEQAILYFKKASKLSPDNEKVLLNLKMANKFYDEIKTAAIQLEKDLDQITQGNNKENIGTLYIAKQKLDYAVGKYKKALIYQPGFKKEHFLIENIESIQLILTKYNNAI